MNFKQKVQMYMKQGWDQNEATALALGQTPAPRQQPTSAAPPVKAKPVKPPVKISKAGNVGVRQNKKTKKKSKASIARSANVVPLQQGAVGYQGLRIS
tara:strand:+ start:364 stop:657 length:294 start_codon:yes stop_codon:yes gene_type:complete